MAIDEQALDRLFGYRHAFDSEATVWLVGIVAALLLATPLVLFILAKMGKGFPSPPNPLPLDEREEERPTSLPQKERGLDQHDELWQRYWSRLVLAALIVGPVLLGGFWTILGVTILSLLC